MNVNMRQKPFCQKVDFLVEHFQNNPLISSANHLWPWQLWWAHCYTQRPVKLHSPPYSTLVAETRELMISSTNQK